jgi:hypothetical protein
MSWEVHCHTKQQLIYGLLHPKLWWIWKGHEKKQFCLLCGTILKSVALNEENRVAGVPKSMALICSS